MNDYCRICVTGAMNWNSYDPEILRETYVDFHNLNDLLVVRGRLNSRREHFVEIMEGPCTGITITLLPDYLRPISPLELLAMEAE